MQRLVIDDFESRENNHLNVYHLLEETNSVFTRRLLGYIEPSTLEELRVDKIGVPHPNLYCYLSPFNTSYCRNINKVVGGCHHFDELNGRILIVVNHEFSNIATDRASAVHEPDQKLISQLNESCILTL